VEAHERSDGAIAMLAVLDLERDDLAAEAERLATATVQGAPAVEIVDRAHLGVRGATPGRRPPASARRAAHAFCTARRVSWRRRHRLPPPERRPECARTAMFGRP
jgi:hypothetical protein